MTVDYTKPPQFSPPPPPPSGSWWSRNWKWVVPIGCLLPIVLFGSCVAGIAWFAVTAIRSSEPYSEALERARRNPEVIGRLGSPIEPKWWLTGNVDLSNDDGSADMKIPISGPKGQAFIAVEGERRNGRWIYSRMIVETPSGNPIDLLEPAPSTEESTDTDPAGG
jgi:hypothetical protein